MRLQAYVNFFFSKRLKIESIEKRSVEWLDINFGKALIFIFLSLLNISKIGQCETQKCRNVDNFFEDNILTQLAASTFNDLIKITECELLEVKNETVDDEAPPDIIKVPPRKLAEPLEILSNLFIEDLSHIDEEKMQFRVDFHVLQSWTAQKKYCNLYYRLLKTIEIDLRTYNDSSKMLQMSIDFFKYFWIPDIFVVNAKQVTLQSQDPVSKSLQAHVRENKKENGGDDTGGTLCKFSLSGRFTATIPCAMDFRFYPVDVQNCQLFFRSFSYPINEVSLKWFEPPRMRNLKLPQHKSKISSSDGIYVNVLYSRLLKENNNSLDNIPAEHQFSILTVNIRLSRDISNKIAGVYIPTALIVAVCFSTFWFGPKSISDRVTVGVTALLAFITQFIETRKFIPPISYISLMDIWMLMCMVFVFIQLVEGTIVHYFYQKGKHLRRLRRKNVKRSLKVFEQKNENLNKLSKNLSPFFEHNLNEGKWHKDHGHLNYETPSAELLINRLKDVNYFQQKKKVNFGFKNSRVQSQKTFGKKDAKQFGIGSSSLSNFDKLNKNISNSKNKFSILKENWLSDKEINFSLSAAELRNLNLLELISDQSVRNWLTETIFPDHVHFGLISLLKYYWKVLFTVDLPRSSAHYRSLQIDKYARVLIPSLYIFFLGVYVLVIWSKTEVDSKTINEKIFSYKDSKKT